jgi:hypothetical protein
LYLSQQEIKDLYNSFWAVDHLYILNCNEGNRAMAAGNKVYVDSECTGPSQVACYCAVPNRIPAVTGTNPKFEADIFYYILSNISQGKVAHVPPISDSDCKSLHCGVLQLENVSESLEGQYGIKKWISTRVLKHRAGSFLQPACSHRLLRLSPLGFLPLPEQEQSRPLNVFLLDDAISICSISDIGAKPFRKKGYCLRTAQNAGIMKIMLASTFIIYVSNYW